MEAKQKLKQIRRIDLEIAGYLEEQRKLKEQLISIKSQTFDDIRVKQTPEGDKIGKGIAQIEEWQDKINDRLKDLFELKREIDDTITKMPNEEYRVILWMRYFNYKKWEEIAVLMNYGYRHITRLHGKALQEFEKTAENQNMSENVL